MLESVIVQLSLISHFYTPVERMAKSEGRDDAIGPLAARQASEQLTELEPIKGKFLKQTFHLFSHIVMYVSTSTVPCFCGGPFWSVSITHECQLLLGRHHCRIDQSTCPPCQNVFPEGSIRNEIAYFSC